MDVDSLKYGNNGFDPYPSIMWIVGDIIWVNNNDPSLRPNGNDGNWIGVTLPIALQWDIWGFLKIQNPQDLDFKTKMICLTWMMIWGYPHDLGNRPILYPQIVGCVLLSSLLGLKPLQDLRDPGVHAEFRRHGSGKGVDCFSATLFFGHHFQHPFFKWDAFGTAEFLLNVLKWCPPIVPTPANQHFQIPSMFAFDVIISASSYLSIYATKTENLLPEVSPDEKFQQTKNQGSPEGGAARRGRFRWCWCCLWNHQLTSVCNNRSVVVVWILTYPYAWYPVWLLEVRAADRGSSRKKTQCTDPPKRLETNLPSGYLLHSHGFSMAHF